MRKVAEAVGVNEGHLSNVLCGSREPSADLIRRIAEALHVPVANLTSEQGADLADDMRVMGQLMAELPPALRANVITYARGLAEGAAASGDGGAEGMRERMENAMARRKEGRRRGAG